MALSGIFYGTTSNPRLKPQISWEAVQSVEGNYSDITAKLQYTRSNSGYTSGGTWKGSLTIGDETVERTLYMEITYGNVTTVITHTARVYHDADGAKTLTISATGGITKPAEASLKSTSISEEITLDTIPRASNVSATDCNVGGCSTVVLDKKSSSFLSSLSYRFGSLSGYVTGAGGISDTEEIFSQTVLNFSVPERFYEEIPGSPTGVCTLTCRTYQGSTLVGSRETNFTVTASESLCAPEISIAVTDGNAHTKKLSGGNALVLNASRAVCTVTATPKNSATIKNIQVAGHTQQESVTLSPLVSPTIAYSATDSRDYTTQKVYTPEIVPYVPLTANVSVKRETPTGDTAIIKVTGQCFRGSFGAVENLLAIDVVVSEIGINQQVLPQIREDNTYEMTLPISGFAYNQSYDISLKIADRVQILNKTARLLPGVPVFDWGEGDFRFHVPVYMPKLYVNETEVKA